MKNTFKNIGFFIILISISFQQSLYANTLTSGPMPGHSAMRSAQIWLQTKNASNVKLEYWPNKKNHLKTSTAVIKTIAKKQYTALFTINDLSPGTTYQYNVIINTKKLHTKQGLFFKTQTLWQHRKDPPDFNIAMGSCAYINDLPFDRPGKPFGSHFEIFQSIANQQPDMMLWLGDNIYLREADFDSAWGIADRYTHSRKLPELQKLLQSTHHYATWDDHDYGPNNSNKSFPLKADSLKTFKNFWANPSYGLPDTPGVFTKFNFNDVDFFLLDNRYYRNSDKAPNTKDKTLFGKQQIAWLKDALLGSNAPFKIIVSGSQLLNTVGHSEGWHRFPNERNHFLKWLETTNIKGILFLSGDRHRTELLKRERNNKYPLYELTCSPLTSGIHKISNKEKTKPHLLPKTLVAEHNFCMLNISGKRKKRIMTLSAYNAQGQPIWEHKVHEKELR